MFLSQNHSYLYCWLFGVKHMFYTVEYNFNNMGYEINYDKDNMILKLNHERLYI